MQENSPLLQLQNVGYLAGDAKILNNINFSLRAGEFKLITGPSGCGKSTLLKIVASLISPTSGTLLFEGEDVSTLKDSILTKNIAELSGGEKQRISLIRNLQFMPKVLLLDEITSALDESNKHNVNEMIHRYVREQNIAVLWVTHDKDEINHADKVITLQPHAGEMQEARYELA